VPSRHDRDAEISSLGTRNSNVEGLMTPTLYLFCNESYGSPYMATAQRFARQYKVKVILIFSGKYTLPEKVTHGFFAQAWAFAKKRIEENRLKRTYHLPVRIISDINSPPSRGQICSCDYGVISGFNQIFKKQTIERFKVIVNLQRTGPFNLVRNERGGENGFHITQSYRAD